MSLRSQPGIDRSIKQDGFSDFREDIAPLIDALRKQFEAEDAVLLSMLEEDGADYLLENVL